MDICRHQFQAMGSPCSVHVYAPTQAQAQAAALQAEAEVRRLEQKYSRYRDDSITATIHRNAKAGAATLLDAETAALLHYAHTAWEQSDGLFDITSGLLRRAWNFRSGTLPSQQQIDALLPRIGWDKVSLDNNQIRFQQPDMEIDFGGFVKEYAADSAAAILQQHAIQHGLVELGGDIRVIGPHPDDRPWAVGIRHPRQPGQVLATLNLTHGALASSGDYERCILHNGKRYGHVLNPHTGWPVEGVIAVSVVADHCLLAGSATTLTLLRGNYGIAWLEQQGLSWLAMDDVGQVYGTLADPVSCAHV